jgi:hypothetical protein
MVAQRRLGGKLKVVMKPDQARKVQPDLEALLEAEGLAMRAGPREDLARCRRKPA